MSDVTTTIFLIFSTVWLISGLVGDHIRKHCFGESPDFSNVLLGPITFIISGVEVLIIKCQEHKLHKTRKEAQKPIDKYEKRAIERINMLLEINN